MESEKQKAGSPPNFKGDGMAVWVNKTVKSETYLSVQLFGKNGVKVNCFKYTGKPKEEAPVAAEPKEVPVLDLG